MLWASTPAHSAHNGEQCHRASCYQRHSAEPPNPHRSTTLQTKETNEKKGNRARFAHKEPFQSSRSHTHNTQLLFVRVFFFLLRCIATEPQRFFMFASSFSLHFVD